MENTKYNNKLINWKEMQMDFVFNFRTNFNFVALSICKLALFTSPISKWNYHFLIMLSFSFPWYLSLYYYIQM